MKKIAVFILILAAGSAGAVEGKQVAYAGGTAAQISAGTIGQLDTQTALVFVHPGGKLTIPFDRIESFEYTEERARRLGVLPTIAIGLFKRLQRRHFFRLAYRDESDLPQAAVFEVPKQMPEVLNAVLKARVPPKPRRAASSPCGGIETRWGGQ